MQFRIPVATLPGTYADGEVLTADKLNLVVNVLRTGVNANYNDYLKLVVGSNQVYATQTLEALQTIGESLGEDDDGIYGLVLSGIEDEESPDIETLMVYQFDAEAEEFVQVFDDEVVSFIGILEKFAEFEDSLSGVTSNATAGATHAAITTGANPHATTFANITSKPTTVAGYGITDAATLVGGTVPANQLPSYVDDVIEGVYINSTAFTVDGNIISPESGKIYISTSGTEDGKTFRYTGTQYVVVSDTLAIGNTSTTAFAGNLGLDALNNATLAAGWGNHATVGYLTNASTRIADIENFANNTANNVANINNTINGVSNNLSNLTNTVTNISNDYLTSASVANASNWDDAFSWGNHANAGYANGTNEADWDTAYGWGDHADAGYVVNTTNIANLPLTGDITASNLTAELDTATTETKGLMSAEDKENLDALQALMGDDENSVVDRITEVLTIFEDYPEGADLVTALGDKLDADDERIDDWDEAYGWGDHANAGYAPGTNVSNWDTAFGWGNHASVGYLTAEADTLDTVVNRGSVTNNATINYITTTRTDFNTTATDGYTTGQVGWDADSGTLSVGLLNGTTAKVGQQTMYYVQADETLTTGDVVQFNGVAGFKPKVKKAVASEINNMPSLLMGFVTGNIGTGNLGYVTSFGLLRSVNTANFGTAGQILYYDSNTSNAAGKTITTVPTAPNAKIELASVVREATGGSSNGELLVRVGTSTSLAFDSSVQLSTPVSGEVLAYNGTAGRWENAEVVSLGLNVSTSNLQNGQYLKYADGLWVNDDLVVYGSVNSVGLNMPTGFTVANSPITDSGTLGVTYAEGYSLPATSTQDNWNSAFGWGNHQAVGYIVGLANATVTDGNIASWNGTTGKLLKDTGVAISSVLTSESDPVFTASNAFGITGTDKTNWNAAFAWGNHALAGYGNVVGAGTVVSGNIATYNGTTGAILGAGYSVETTLTNNATVIPTSSAVTTYVDAQIGDIESILDDIIG
jgi:hypothetical protein